MKEFILKVLHQKNSMREIHEKVKEQLVGCLLNEYLGKQIEKERIVTATFHAVVQALTSSLLYGYYEKIVDEIINIIEENPKLTKGGNQ